MNSAPRIVPHVWFGSDAKEIAEFYASILPNSKIHSAAILPDTPSGPTTVVMLDLYGQEFQFLSAGEPLFNITPAISFIIQCASSAEVDSIYNALSVGGTPLVPLGSYPFSERFAWFADKYGLTWQVSVSDRANIVQRIIPSFMFVREQLGKAEEAVHFYASVFPNAHIDHILHYGEGEPPDAPGTVKGANFRLGGMEFFAMDSAQPHDFTFNEAISIIVYCDTQAEIDHYWDKLSAVPEAEACGWLKDRFGVSWQIVPTAMDAMMNDSDSAKVARVTEAFLKMKNFDLAELERVYKGVPG
ncbi:MAG: hypothetical protein CUN53_13030 [Phototrophicales bacterium]|nr:MAG: hypothetical protein CUN53_13030 [Phototrophicales bacterium]